MSQMIVNAIMIYTNPLVKHLDVVATTDILDMLTGVCIIYLLIISISLTYYVSSFPILNHVLKTVLYKS